MCQRAAGVLTSTEHGACLFDGLRQYTQSIVQRALSLVQDLLRRSAQDDGARLICARKHISGSQEMHDQSLASLLLYSYADIHTSQHFWPNCAALQTITANLEHVNKNGQHLPMSTPEKCMRLSSPIMTSSISLQWPIFTSSGWSKVEVISPPEPHKPAQYCQYLT